MSRRSFWRRVGRQQWLGLVLVWPWLLTFAVMNLVEDGFSMWRLYFVILTSTIFAFAFANEVVRWLK